MDILGEKGRVMVNGISLNNFITLTNNKMKIDKKNSEKFKKHLKKSRNTYFYEIDFFMSLFGRHAYENTPRIKIE